METEDLIKRLVNRIGSRQFGAFRGVFIPTFLSIVGVILYLRLGYIVGSIGILGTLLILILAVTVTVSTALSLSSITTNIRIGAGGAYSIISKTLGLEIGGSTGLPLYLAQTLSVALYIFGFKEAWKFLFPNQPGIIVVYGIFIALFLLTFINLKYAIHAQLIVFFIVIASLVSIFAGGNWLQNIYTPGISAFSRASFWPLFALFFPAVTGLMAGVGMSGELTDPKRQIPKGVLWGVGVTALIYIFMTFWLGFSASPEVLTGNNLIMVELAKYAPLVLLGILSATFSSALTTFAAAPRLLNALGKNSILPLSNFFSKRSEGGEPRNATIFTAFLIFITVSLGSLNKIAPILTMFFLISYTMINFSVFIEQTMGFVSFRPTFKISKLIPLYGVLASVAFMFYINPIAGILALVLVFLTYVYLVKRKLKPEAGDIRSGLFYALTEWAAKKVYSLPESKKHVWKANLLIPVVTSETLLSAYSLIKSILYPNGTLTVLGLKADEDYANKDLELDEEQLEKEQKALPELVEKFGKEGFFTSYTKVDCGKDYVDDICIAFQALEGQFFHPNILFLPAEPTVFTQKQRKKMLEEALSEKTGMVFFDKSKDIGLGSEKDIHIWLPSDVLEKDFYEDRSFDLAMLTGYQLYKNWVGRIVLWMPEVDKEDESKARLYLKRLIYEARLPAGTEYHVSSDSFKKIFKKAPKEDIHILPFKDADDLKNKLKTTKEIDRSYLYVFDSTGEDILA
ncbi:MAG: amino acid permease [Candidatus Undinarchaeales archaeon]